jgi:predicted permease
MRPLARLVRRLVPVDWRETVERDLAEEASRRTRTNAGAEFWIVWHTLRIGVGLRWHRGRTAAGLSGAGIARADAPLNPVHDRRRHFRAALTVTHDAWRALRHSPSTTGFGILILTVAIAAATVTFSVVDAIVLRSLPFANGDRIVMFGRDVSHVHSRPEFVAWREQADAFGAIAALEGAGALVQLSPGAEFPYGRAVAASASLFDVLQVQPHLGRLFTVENEASGRDGVAVISYELWQREFGADPDAIGQTLRLVHLVGLGTGGVSETVLFKTILGVMPAGFTYPLDGSRRHVWIPLVPRTPVRADSRSLTVLGRLRDGAAVDEAQVQLATIKAAVAAGHGVTLRGDGQPRLLSLQDYLIGAAKGSMLLVLMAAGLLMLVACVNVAHLMLARTTARTRALAVRASLGASSRRLGAVLLGESLLLALTAAAGGIVLAHWGVDVAKAVLPADTFRADTIAIDLRVLAVAIAIAVGSGLVFGIVPAWQAARVHPASLLNAGPAVTSGNGRWRATFLTAEVTLAAALLVVSTMFVGSFIRVVRTDLGFARSELLVVDVQEVRHETTTILESLRQTPGVTAVAESAGVPPLLVAADQVGSYSITRWQLSREGSAGFSSGSIEPMVYRVSPDYFRTTGIPVRRGRVFVAGDSAHPVAVVDERTAAFLFPDDAHAVGRLLPAAGSSPALRILGVVAAVSTDGPEMGRGAQIYLPKEPSSAGTTHLLIRTAAPVHVAAPNIHAALERALPAGVAVPPLRSLDDAFRELTTGRRANATIMSLLGVMVLLIASAGVYAVMASTVAQQQRELGVRVALGATRARIIRSVLGRAALYLAVGLAAGLAVGWALSTLFAAMLFEVQPGDASIYAIVGALLLTAGLVAALQPAVRAARVDPIRSLRAE